MINTPVMKTILLIILMTLSGHAFGAEVAFDIFNKFSPSVVLIQTKLNSSGTGFFVTPGLILTNRHVVRSFNKKVKMWDAPKSILLKNGKLISKFNKIICSLRVDVCAISVDTETTIKDFSKLSIVPSSVGQEVFIVGHPQGIMNPIISSGIVSSEVFLVPGHDHKRKSITFRGFTTTAAISPGSSGSPVLSSTGMILGIAVSILQGAQNLNIIIGSEELSLFAKQIARRDESAIFNLKLDETPALLSKPSMGLVSR